MSQENVILCRVNDVDAALVRAFKRFMEEGKKSLNDLQGLMQDEFSNIDSFEVAASALEKVEMETQPEG